MENDAALRAPASTTPDHLLALAQLVSGYRVSQAIYVAVTLGIFDLLRDGPRENADLAAATETHAASLYRVLRFLAGVGLFDEVAPGRFALTALGAGMRTDAPGSVAPMAANLLNEHHWQPWGNLLHTVRTGETAWQHTHGLGYFDFFAQHPAAAETFNRAMTSASARSGDAIVRRYPFDGIERLIDVGGGHGLTLATVLRAHPTMRGVLFDSPSVVAGAAPVLEAAGIADRCEVVGGDFFAAIPPDGDAYILRQILHDWYDDDAVRILTNCREAMPADGRILVVERAISPDYRRSLQVLHLDLEMLVNVGGIQRTDDEYREIFGRAGLTLTAIVPLQDPGHYAVFEGRKA